MRSTSAIYNTLRSAVGSYYEVQVVCGLKTYNMDVLKSVRITQSLFSGKGLQIGGTTSAQCELTLMEDTANWPRMAQFTVRVRLVDANHSQVSEWLNIGKFYTDERSADGSGNLYIIGFDAMLLLEQSWTDKITTMPSTWPVTSKTAANLISTATGIAIDSRSNLDDVYAYIGLNTASTAREVMASVAAGMGGNWTITPEGKLRLIPVMAGDSVSGFNLYNYVSTVEIGAPYTAISGVELTTNISGNTAKAGLTTGYVMKANCDFSNTDVAALCLSKLTGKVYRPFAASKALLDPAVELGDMITDSGTTYQIASIVWNLSNFITAEIAAPWEAEVDHEYQVKSELAKYLEKAYAADRDLETSLKTLIQQTEQNITLSAQETYTTKQEFQEASNGTYVLQVPYNYTSTTTTFYAKVYRNLTDVTDDFEASQFTWYKYTESTEGPTSIGTGKTITVNNSDIGYGGVVICKLTYSDHLPLVDENGDPITDENGDPLLTGLSDIELITETAMYQEGYIHDQFAAVDIRPSGVTISASEYLFDPADGIITDLDSAIQVMPTEILSTVAASYVQQEKGIVGASGYYLRSENNTGVTASDSGWSTSNARVTSAYPYLWAYTLFSYGDDATQATEAELIGTYGKGVSGSTVYNTAVNVLFYLSNSATKPSAPTAAVTSTSTDPLQWTRTFTANTDDYPYIYYCYQVTWSDSTYTWSTVSSVATIWNTYEQISSISQKADSIESIVSDGDGLISKINQSAGSVTINANKINLQGVVKITDIDGTDPNSTVTIDGGKIQANSINASKIAIGDFTNLITVSELIGTDSAVAATDSTLGGSTVASGYITKPTASVSGMKLCDWTPVNFTTGDAFAYDLYARCTTSGYGYLRIYYASSQTPGSYSFISAGSLYLTTTDTNFSGKFTISSAPAGDYYCIVLFRSSYQVYLHDASLRKKINGSLIVDGTITADAIKLGGDMTVYNSTGSTTVGGYIGYCGSGSTSGGMDVYGSGMHLSSANGKAEVFVNEGSSVSVLALVCDSTVLASFSNKQLIVGGQSAASSMFTSWYCRNGLSFLGGTIHFGNSSWPNTLDFQYATVNNFSTSSATITALSSTTATVSSTLTASIVRGVGNTNDLVFRRYYTASTYYSVWHRAGVLRKGDDSISDFSLGSSGYPWTAIYGTTIYQNGTAVSTSDRRLKQNINYDIDKYVDILEKIKPCSFKYVDGTSGRTHVGMIAQDVEEAMTDLGISMTDWAAVCVDHTYYDENGVEIDTPDKAEIADHVTDTYYLRYSDFVPLLIAQNQKQQESINEQEARISALEDEVAELKALVRQLLQQN